MADDTIVAELRREEVGDLLMRAYGNFELNANGSVEWRRKMLANMLADPENVDGEHQEIHAMLNRCTENARQWQERVEYFVSLLEPAE